MLDSLMTYATMAVDRLIRQYQEYVHLDAEIKQLDEQAFLLMGKLAKEHELSLADIQTKRSDYPELVSLDLQKKIYERMLNRLSDEMTFANPLIWMMYKHKAYKGTSTEIATIDDFRRHCAPVDYICGKRYRFLVEKLHGKLDSEELFPSDTSLDHLYRDEIILELCMDPDFMKEWQEQEYKISQNRINKWNSLSLE